MEFGRTDEGGAKNTRPTRAVSREGGEGTSVQMERGLEIGRCLLGGETSQQGVVES